MRPRRRSFVVVVAVLAATGVLVSTSGVAPAGAAECARVTIIGVAGSGQTPGLGDQVDDLVDGIQMRLDRAGRSVEVVPLAYPATDVARSFGLVLFNGRYRRSVAAGVASLHAAVADVIARCPETVLVLAGYSQGAQVVKEGLGGIDPTSPIAAVVLLADPTRVPDQAGTLRVGETGSSRAGILGPVPIPARFGSRTIDVCAAADFICSPGRFRPGGHLWGYDGLAEVAADVAVSKVLILSRFWRPA